jgi:hypothetical protein
MDDHQPAQLAQGRLGAGQGAAPGEELGLALLDAGQAVGERAGEGGDVADGGRLLLHAHRHGGEAGHQAAQARIGGDRAQERLGALQLPDGLGHLLRRRGQQQPFALEIGAAVGLLDLGEQRLVLAELGGQPVGARARELRRGAVDDDDDRITLAREGAIEGDLALAPVELGRDQSPRVAGQGEIIRGEEQRRNAQNQAGHRRQAGVAAAPLDDADQASRRKLHGVKPFAR